MRASAFGDLMVQVNDDLVELGPFRSRDMNTLLGPTASEAPELTDQTIDLRGTEREGRGAWHHKSSRRGGVRGGQRSIRSGVTGRGDHRAVTVLHATPTGGTVKTRPPSRQLRPSEIDRLIRQIRCLRRSWSKDCTYLPSPARPEFDEIIVHLGQVEIAEC